MTKKNAPNAAWTFLILCKWKYKRGRFHCAKVTKTSRPFIFWRLHPPQCTGLEKYIFPQFPAQRCQSTNSRCTDRQKKKKWQAETLRYSAVDNEAERERENELQLCSTRPKVNAVKKNKALWALFPGSTRILAQCTQPGIVPEVEVLLWHKHDVIRLALWLWWDLSFHRSFRFNFTFVTHYSTGSVIGFLLNTKGGLIVWYSPLHFFCQEWIGINTTLDWTKWTIYHVLYS